MAPNCFLVILGIQRARDIRSDDMSGSLLNDNEMYGTPAERLLVLLRDGPDAGLHVMAWLRCDPQTLCEQWATAFGNLDRELPDL